MLVGLQGIELALVPDLHRREVGPRPARLVGPDRDPDLSRAQPRDGPVILRAVVASADQVARAQVGDRRALCGLSGGVDSAVAAAVVHKAIGDQLTCVFVDTGLLRKDEATQVVTLFRDHYNIPLVHADATELFLKALAGVTDPEQKRKTIGSLFIDVFDAEAKKIGGADFLAQGTLYPDVIESVSFTGGPSVTIKSHHNVGGLPETLNLKLLEPLRELFKDEVFFSIALSKPRLSLISFTNFSCAIELFNPKTKNPKM